MEKRIAILITNFEGGGAQKVALTHARMFKDLGYNVDIIAIEHQDSYIIPNDFPIHFLSSMQGQGSKLKKLLLSPTLPFRLAHYLRKNKINLCISHLERADFVNILAKFINKHKTIAIIHSHLTSTYKTEKISLSRLTYKFLVRILTPFNNKIVAVSRGIAQDLASFGIPSKKIQVILNPFDINAIRQKAKAKLEKFNDIFDNDTIISIGRLSNQKGIWHTILAFSQLKKERENLKYIILGDGPLRQYHLKLANDLGLLVYDIWDTKNKFSDTYDIYFLGFQDNPFQFIAKSKMLILSSHFEGLPNVLVESLIIGTPVIASDVDSGPRELLAPQSEIRYKTDTLEKAEYGLLIPVDKYKSPKEDLSHLSESETYIINGVNLLLDDNNMRENYTLKSKKRVDDFQLEHIIPQWKTLLEIFVTE